ncbi:MAG TPA: hypothetical protein PKW18_13835 [Candidatus Sumerlaeota bacterium]|nr:hypothetical protein [Candidatus Sumerlaeota bacterium]HOR65957.1 hypothetical protein [Candidatus Sumerlaeota bacterium]HPL75635.1 hypothetical protein [Candidatus Sumerlaeota bacterium]HRR31990.1 hypothetical protein [Candidatus Sumerlaeia bacterium]
MAIYRTLTGKDGGGIDFAEVLPASYVATLDGDNLSAMEDFTGIVSLVGIRSDGNPEAVPVDNMLCPYHFYLQGGIDQPATESGDYYLVIPVGAQESGGAFAAGGAGKITVMGVSLCAGFYSGSGIITGSTTIRVSNKKYLTGGANYIDCTLTATGAETDRRNSKYGSFTVNTASEALFVHFKAVGGHGAINGWVWTRRVLDGK